MNTKEAEHLSLEVEKICPNCGKKMILEQFKRNPTVLRGVPAFESLWLCQTCHIEWVIRIWVD